VRSLSSILVIYTSKDWNRKDQWSLLRAFSRFVERCEPDMSPWKMLRACRTRGVRRILSDLGKETLLKSSGKFWIAGSTAFHNPENDWFLSHLVGCSKIAKKTHPDSKDWITVRKSNFAASCFRSCSSSAEDPVHVSSRLSRTNLNRIKASKPAAHGGIGLMINR